MTPLEIILLIIVLVIVCGGGYGYSRDPRPDWWGPNPQRIVGLILVIVLILVLVRYL